MKYLIFYALLTASFFGGEIAFGEKVRIVPAAQKISPNGNLIFAFYPPCTGTYKGLVFQESGTKISVGAAYLISDGSTCSSLTAPKLIEVPILKKLTYSEFHPLPNSITNKTWKLKPVEEVYTTQGKISLRHSPACHKNNPLVLINHRKKLLTFGTLVGKSSKRASTKCESGKLKVTSQLRAIGIRSGASFTSYRPPVKNLRKLYRLKLAKIVTKSTNRLPGGGIKLKYEHRCNEAPVGIVVSSKIKSAKNKVKLGMLVAEYPNVVCPSPKETIVSTYKNTQIDLPKNYTASLIKLSGTIQKRLKLLTPNIKLWKNKRAKGITVNADSLCTNPLGTVYGLDAYDNLVVSLLSLKGNCHPAPFHTKISHPFLSKNRSNSRIFPLKLNGQTI